MPHREKLYLYGAMPTIEAWVVLADRKSPATISVAVRREGNMPGRSEAFLT